MENKGELNTENQKQSFLEKYGMWLFVAGIMSAIIILKIILDMLQK